MLRISARHGGIGWLAALAAAYALVFQLVFASALVASLAQAGTDLCFGASVQTDDADAARDPGGTGTALQVHCPACLARVDILDLPPPVVPPAVVRAAVPAAFAPAAPAAPALALVRLPQQPRAPPVLS